MNKCFSVICIIVFVVGIASILYLTFFFGKKAINMIIEKAEVKKGIAQ